FVLSGFLIGSILLKMFLSEEFTTKNLFVFLKRRWFRTLPAYYLVLIINIVVASFFSYDISGSWKYFLFIQNFSNYDIVIFTESWSLSVEEWTYIIAPLLLFFGYKVFKSNKKMGFLFVSIFLILFFHLLRYDFYLNAKISNMQTWNLAVKSLVVFRIDSILIGFLVAWWHCFYKEILKKYSVYLFIISIHLFFLQFVVLNVMGVDIMTKPFYFIVFYFTFSSLTMALGLPFFVNWEFSNGMLVKPIQFVSKVSYSVYLLHYSIIAVLMKQFFNPENLSSFALLGLIGFYLAAVFFLSFLLYKYYEKPIMDLRDKI
ncbi:MAG TPA: acyltransferase, partial [Flavobacterium sp.]|uniref:acyltransferase family protein n=1 Tax=Flavobacterium sp. TaxID=239 RepID=UPI002C120D79